MKDLPITQAGPSRHKCAVCAFEHGYLEGYSAALNAITSSMPKSKEEILGVKESNDMSVAKKIALSIKEKFINKD